MDDALTRKNITVKKIRLCMNFDKQYIKNSFESQTCENKVNEISTNYKFVVKK